MKLHVLISSQPILVWTFLYLTCVILFSRYNGEVGDIVVGRITEVSAVFVAAHALEREQFASVHFTHSFRMRVF